MLLLTQDDIDPNKPDNDVKHHSGGLPTKDMKG